MTSMPYLDEHDELDSAAQRLAGELQNPQRQPPLADVLQAYPSHVFSPRLYASLELAERMALALALGAAERIGLWHALDEPRTPAGIAATLGLASGFLPALDWLLHRLTAAGYLGEALVAGEPAFAQRREPPTGDAVRAEVALVRRAALAVDPCNAATFDLLEHAATQYPPVARGEISGQDALLGEGTVELWLRYFSNDNPLYAVNNWVAGIAAAERLRELARVRGELRILEVGAGAGSGSARLLDRLRQEGLLDHVRQIHITEPGAFLLRKAQRALAREAGHLCRFASLDINCPWTEQGVEEEGVDLIYAVNVLHVANDLPFTLAQAYRCLAPGGSLVAGECLRPEESSALSIEIVFRLLEDPTVITHAEQRPRAGFLEWRHWQAALQAAGFAAVSCEPDQARIRAAVYPRLYVGAVCARR